jgi:hypothetical protein
MWERGIEQGRVIIKHSYGTECRPVCGDVSTSQVTKKQRETNTVTVSAFLPSDKGKRRHIRNMLLIWKSAVLWKYDVKHCAEQPLRRMD